MKRIVMKSRVIFTQRKDGKVLKTFVFEKGKPYDVDDAVAANPFIKERTASVEAVKKEASKKAKAEVVAEEKEAEDDKSASNS